MALRFAINIVIKRSKKKSKIKTKTNNNYSSNEIKANAIAKSVDDQFNASDCGKLGVLQSEHISTICWHMYSRLYIYIYIYVWTYTHEHFHYAGMSHYFLLTLLPLQHALSFFN